MPNILNILQTIGGLISGTIGGLVLLGLFGYMFFRFFFGGI
jgi:hypothetical protein